MHARLKCCTGVGSIRHARIRAPSCHISPPPRCHKQTTSYRPSCPCSDRAPCQGPLPSPPGGFSLSPAVEKRNCPSSAQICSGLTVEWVAPLALPVVPPVGLGLHTPLRVPELVLASLLPPRPGLSRARLASRTAAASACLGVTCLGIRLEGIIWSLVCCLSLPKGMLPSFNPFCGAEEPACAIAGTVRTKPQKARQQAFVCLSAWAQLFHPMLTGRRQAPACTSSTRRCNGYLAGCRSLIFYSSLPSFPPSPPSIPSLSTPFPLPGPGLFRYALYTTICRPPSFVPSQRHLTIISTFRHQHAPI